MNIEKTISEQAVSDILTPMLECQDRIVTEDVAPLFDQATGLDTPPASGTVTTTIEESRSVITAIIRKAWTATLTMLGGASVLSSIAAAYTYLRNRLLGNETYGIPDRRSEISASSPLAANLALLNDRKIGGVPEAADGMSLVHMICSSTASEITELVDDNEGWEYAHGTGGNDTTRSFPFNIFTNLKVLTLKCKGVLGYAAVKDSSTLEVLNIPDVTELRRIPYQLSPILNLTALKTLYAPSVGICINESTDYECVRNCDNLQKIVLGKLTIFYDFIRTGEPNLIHFEIGAGTAISLNMSWWSPTNALDASRTDLIEEGSTAQNNLQQFLSNFRDYIALRLTDNGSGKTLTLSQAVRNAIHAAEATYGIENIIITQKGWTISPAPYEEDY